MILPFGIQHLLSLPADAMRHHKSRKAVYVFCAEFKRAVTFHFITAFFLFGKDGQAVTRSPVTLHS